MECCGALRYRRLSVKGGSNSGAFLHTSLGLVLSLNNLDVSTLLVNTNICYLYIKPGLWNIHFTLDYLVIYRLKKGWAYCMSFSNTNSFRQTLETNLSTSCRKYEAATLKVLLQEDYVQHFSISLLWGSQWTNDEKKTFTWLNYESVNFSLNKVIVPNYAEKNRFYLPPKFKIKYNACKCMCNGIYFICEFYFK